MEDRFRFRAWQKSRKRYLYDFEEDEYFGDALIDDDMVVEQCTGLKDKNGKLIYEGDILRLVSETAKIKYVVKWDGHNAQLFLDVLNDWGQTEFNIADLNYLEIIGNIHENPKLLEK